MFVQKLPNSFLTILNDITHRVQKLTALCFILFFGKVKTIFFFGKAKSLKKKDLFTCSKNSFRFSKDKKNCEASATSFCDTENLNGYENFIRFLGRSNLKRYECQFAQVRVRCGTHQTVTQFIPVFPKCFKVDGRALGYSPNC